MVLMRADENSLTAKPYWIPLWGNMHQTQVNKEELNAISKMAERVKIPASRFETIIDARGQKNLRLKKIKERCGEFTLHDYYFVPVFFERGHMYSIQRCPKKGKKITLQDEELASYIKSYTGIRPSVTIVKQLAARKAAEAEKELENA